mgnify:CR=1 FL=1
MSSIIYLSKDGYDNLKNNLHQLKSVDRPNIINQISEARDKGDLSENAEYDAAKEKQGFIEGRIAEVEGKLSNCVVIDPASLNAGGKCVFGSTVEILNLETDLRSTYQIVGDDESDIKSKKISINSPLAKSLIGKQEEDDVEFETPGGRKNFEILSVKYI